MGVSEDSNSKINSDTLVYLKNNTNPLLLLLSTNKKRKKLTEQYNYFKDENLTGGGYTKSVENLLKAYKEVDCSKQEVIDLTVNRAYIYDFIDTLIPDLTKRDYEYAYYPEYADVYDEILDKLPSIISDDNDDTYYIGQSEDKIKRAVELYVALKVQDKLKKIPIQDLHVLGNAKGILADNNIQNCGRLMSKPISYIMSFDGIRRRAAIQIVDEIDELTTHFKDGVKLKISEDEKTKEQTKILVSVVTYLRIKDAKKELDTIIAQFNPPIEKMIEYLSYITTFKSWLVINNTQKEYGVWAYQNIATFLDSQIYERISSLTQTLINPGVTAAQAWQVFHDNAPLIFTTLEQFVPEYLGSSDSDAGLPQKLFEAIQNEKVFPDGLLVTLRKYQEIGVRYILHQERVILGDDMGLGKTIQAIATMVSLRNCGYKYFMVICPASVVNNWCKEITSKSELSAIKVHGIGKEQAFEDWLSLGGVAVTNYESLRKIEMPEGFKISELIVDEAHYIKNPDALRSKRTINICKNADRVVLMTGTVLENNVSEMIRLINIVRPDIAQELPDIASINLSEDYRETVAPVYFRRKKEDVLNELPELTVSTELLEMGKIERREYENHVYMNRNFMQARRVSWDVHDIKNSCKAQRMLEIVKEATESRRNILVLSFFLDTLNKVKKMIGDRCAGVITGATSLNDRQQIIQNFNQSKGGEVLLLQIKAGGVGLNIQGASVVIICEPQLTPAIENQAISRAHRMGQTRNVLVYRLVCSDSIDTSIEDGLKYKRLQFKEFANESVAADNTVTIDSETSKKMLQEGIERIKKKRGLTK